MSHTSLSQEAYARLAAELEELKTTGRTRIAQTIEEARAHGDIRENAEYQTAKEEQGRIEARVRQLQALLREAHVRDPGQRPAADAVVPGVIVTLDVDGDEETYLVAGSREERHAELDVLSIVSPIGRAVLGSGVGETVSVQAPRGSFSVTVKRIEIP